MIRERNRNTAAKSRQKRRDQLSKLRTDVDSWRDRLGSRTELLHNYLALLVDGATDRSPAINLSGESEVANGNEAKIDTAEVISYIRAEIKENESEHELETDLND